VTCTFNRNVDAIETKTLQKSIGNIFVLATKQLRTTFQNRGAASETDECLREFQGNIAASQNDQMVLKTIEFACFDVGQRLRGAKAWDIGIAA
jgi:hypothetical protein